MIPMMDYVVVSKNDCETLLETLQQIKEQINVRRVILVQSLDGSEKQMELVKECVFNGLIDQLIVEKTGLAFARKLGIGTVETEHFVFVDGDVILPNEWIGMMWGHMDDHSAILGRLYRNVPHYRYMQKNENTSRLVNVRMYTHNTIIRTAVVRDWNPPNDINAYEDYLLTQHILEKGGTIKEVPVFSLHRHMGSDFKAALWGGAGARRAGRFTSIWQVLKSGARMVFGGIKRTFKTDCDWFTIYAVKQAIGMFFGYVFYNRYTKK